MPSSTSRLYQLLAAPLGATYDGTGLKDQLADPAGGLRASFSVAPTLAMGATDLAFVTLQGSGSAYFRSFR